MPELSAAELLKDLNTAQREAVTHGEGPLFVLAGPGSGKTTVIVRRIRYLITQMRTAPEQILVITFTKDAAKSMQQRFIRQSGAGLPVNFGTFHSVFYHILLQSGRSSRLDRIQLLTESVKKSLMIPILKEIRQRAGQSCFAPDNMASDAGEMLAAVSYYKNTGDEAGAAGRLSLEWKPYFKEALSAYQRKTMESGAVDFDDMVYECHGILERDERLREYWQRRFSHILIDEFQDINPMQYQVVKLLADKPYNLFAVGDDDQAIYGFRGSNPACLRQFEKEFGAKRVILNLNYRSRPEIVEASAKVIAENRERYPKDLCAALKLPEAEEPVRITRFQERGEQNAYLRVRIAGFLKAHPEKTCAVLFRTNTYMQSFGAGLAKEGIAYVMREKARNIYEHFVAKDVMAYLRFASGERQRELLLQILNKPSRFLKREALADMEAIDFERWKRWYREQGGARGTECIGAISRLQVHVDAMRRMSPYLAVQYICRAVGYEDWLRGQTAGEGQETKQEWLEILEWLKEEAKEYRSTAEWSEAQKQFGGTACGQPGAQKNPEDSPGKNAVQLMTVHAAKGLEFDHVWMPDCNEKIFPHGSMPDKGMVEEERRIFYVGMTRAKDSLELLWITGSRERPRLMSRFLNQIADRYSSSSTSSSNSQLSRYSSKASATLSYSSSSSM